MPKLSKCDKEKYLKNFCLMGDNKGNPHQAGEWNLEKQSMIFKIMVKKCRFCGVKLREEVMK